MEQPDAIAALAALAQASRLDAFRLLVQSGPGGMAAGRIGERLGLAPATLSFHLNQLRHAGLIRVRRDGRSLIYAAEYASMNALLAYLTENCCQGEAAACGLVACPPAPCADGHAPARPATASLSHPGGPMPVTIYHNPACGTSRNVLGLIRNSGEEPAVVEYLKTPPTRDELLGLIARMGIPARAVLRQKGTPYAELGLDDPTLSDDALIDAMMAHPILINRPIVVTPLGVKLCRPSESVLDILPNPQRAAFAKEDGEQVVAADGRRVAGGGPGQ